MPDCASGIAKSGPRRTVLILTKASIRPGNVRGHYGKRSRLRSSSLLFDAGIYFLNRLIDMGDRASFMAVKMARRRCTRISFASLAYDAPRASPGNSPRAAGRVARAPARMKPRAAPAPHQPLMSPPNSRWSLSYVPLRFCTRVLESLSEHSPADSRRFTGFRRVARGLQKLAIHLLPLPVCGELLIFDANQQFATHRHQSGVTVLGTAPPISLTESVGCYWRGPGHSRPEKIRTRVYYAGRYLRLESPFWPSDASSPKKSRTRADARSYQSGRFHKI